MTTENARQRTNNSDTMRRELLRLIILYLMLTFIATWSCWLAARLCLAYATERAWAGTASGALQVLGTLCPALAVYILFPQLRALGMAPRLRAVHEGGDPREGFWAFAFAPGKLSWGWALFALLACWRWGMFYLAFGFPSTPGVALHNFLATLPALLLGGGLEEIGWRGFLEPALRKLFAGSGTPLPRRRACAAACAPLVCGVIWALWHIPLFFMPGTYQNGLSFLPFLGAAITLSLSFTLLRRTTHGILACILSHAWYNAMLIEAVVPGWLAVVLYALEALVCLSILTVKALHEPISTPPEQVE